MRLAFVIAALGFGLLMSASDTEAQSLQCRQQIRPEHRAACAEAELDDMNDMARYWRREASQNDSDYGYFSNRRERCRSDAPCIVRELQTEISELQSRLAPAARERASNSYRGPTDYQLDGDPRDLYILMERLLRQDSRTWQRNSYDRGSVNNVRVIEQSGTTKVVHGEFTSNNGARTGWVRARFVGDDLQCLTYFDTPGRCVPIGTPYYGTVTQVRMQGPDAQQASMSDAEFAQLMASRRSRRCPSGFC
jgi:uncharacterized protein